MIALLKRTKSVFLLILGLMLIASQAGYAEDATLTNITVSNTQDDLLLFLNLQGAFREEMKQAILSGAPSTFSFFAKLNRVRSLWFDKDIADLEVTHTIVYDNLKKEFTVTRSWKDNNPEVTKSFDEAQKWMTEIDSLKIIPLSRLEKGEQYQLRVKAEVSKKTLPLYLHYILFFVSLWDFETDWYTIDFTF
ncbi:MAG: DUF4390 domain-containing protein [Deltaproteobacteria bacterium]|jgi:hypothetical protein|nr:DUF4390 domain-containing protein [Deltaproteobacteria bacterium]MBW2517270.1 DUF4390 domain-containing protein [Deltaproteobacteria bacterium]